MPWCVQRNEIRPLLSSWSRRIDRIRLIPYGYVRGFGIKEVAIFALSHLPGLRNMSPPIVYVKTVG